MYVHTQGEQGNLIISWCYDWQEGEQALEYTVQ